MLGLGLGSHKASALRSLAAKLLAKLRGRSTYYENNQASKDTIHEIDNYELLDKATILLTPTATSNALVHSVKTYTGNEYITNGDFNGDASGWTLVNAAWQQGSGNGEVKLTKPSSGNSAVYQLGHTYTEGMTLRYKFKIIDYSGSASIRIDGYSGGNPLNTNTTFLASGGDVDITIKTDRAGVGVFLYITGGSTGDYIVLDDISVVDVSSDFDFDRASSATRINSDGLVQDMQSITDPELVLNGDFEELGDDLVANGTFDTDNSDWTKGAGWSIENGVASSDGSQSSNSSLYQLSVLSQYKTYKFQFTLSNVTNGSVRLRNGIGDSETYISYKNIDGTYTAYAKVNASNTTLVVDADADFIGSIDNVSVKQVDPNDRWTVGDKWSLANGVARLVSNDSDGSGFIQSSIFTIGKTYNITFDATVVSGTAKVEGAGGATLILINETKTYNHTFVAGRADLYFNRVSSTSDITIDNISVKDVTFSTDVDLARINYDSNGDNGHILLEPTSTNLVTYSEDFSAWTANNMANVNTQRVLADGITSPDGSVGTSYKLTASQVSSRIQLGSITSSSTYTKSIFVKYAGADTTVRLDGSDTNDRIQFDITSSGVVLNLANSNVISHDIVAYSNDWFRISVTLPSGSDSFQVLPDSANGNSYAYFWGAQLEELSHPTSYIPTLTGSTVTRAADTMPFDTSTIKTPTGDQAVLYLELATSGTTFRTFGGFMQSNGNATYNLYHWASTDNNKFGFNTWNGDSYGFANADFLLDGNFHKIAALFDFTDFTQNKLFIDGVQYSLSQVRGTTVQRPAGALAIDAPQANQRPTGKYKTVALFDEALSDDELELLTGVTNYGSFGELASANGYTII